MNELDIVKKYGISETVTCFPSRDKVTVSALIEHIAISLQAEGSYQNTTIKVDSASAVLFAQSILAADLARKKWLKNNKR